MSASKVHNEAFYAMIAIFIFMLAGLMEYVCMVYHYSLCVCTYTQYNNMYCIQVEIYHKIS